MENPKPAQSFEELEEYIQLYSEAVQKSLKELHIRIESLEKDRELQNNKINNNFNHIKNIIDIFAGKK
jgi:hypothetical protein